MNGNGSTRLWIMGALFAVCMACGGLYIAALNSEVAENKQKIQSLAEAIYDFRSDIRVLKNQMCILQDQMYELREDVTHKRVYRHPCP